METPPAVLLRLKVTTALLPALCRSRSTILIRCGMLLMCWGGSCSCPSVRVQKATGGTESTLAAQEVVTDLAMHY
jgi:hypothetical protein